MNFLFLAFPLTGKTKNGNLGIFEQASAKPSLLELCRAQPKIMNEVRNLCKSNAKKLA